MSIAEIAAHLVGEPWCLTPTEIGRLTIGQVSCLYFAPRDKDGVLKIEDATQPRPLSPKEAFVRRWRKWGLSRERALEMWEEQRPKRKEAKAKRNGRRC